VQKYLARIGVDAAEATAPTYTLLQRLQLAHLTHIPYENLDIMRDVPLQLNEDALFDKMVTRRRGGYCFELNGLFAWLLRGLGYDVAEFFGRFLRGEAEIPMRRHRVLQVTCADGVFLSDVGVGQAIPRAPLPLAVGQKWDIHGETYIIEADDFLGYVLLEAYKGDWRRVYAFTTEPQLPADFEAISFYCEKYPASYFRTEDMVHIFTPTGRKSIAGRTFKQFTPEGVTVQHLENDAAYITLLTNEFGIVL